MEKLQGTVPILRKAAIITLVGFLAITLAGPLLTIAGVLLPFAVVGLLVWIPFRGIMMWKQGGWSAVGDTVKRGLGRVVAIPAWIVARAFGAVAFGPAGARFIVEKQYAVAFKAFLKEEAGPLVERFFSKHGGH